MGVTVMIKTKESADILSYLWTSMPMLMKGSEEEDDTREQKLTCNPAEVNPKFLKELGADLLCGHCCKLYIGIVRAALEKLSQK
ncbi:LOW QUALITY PROTEIN: hypothetical protein PHMEG_00025524 [Phytophthora megakarya]|uniref:Uncharacterized protein n=1 Tax=Phytophthora megakarya TaxID=4795 RepID=A0A225VAX9_9STRA|nr:LOW QUALITY PROTEIN: hypothetical protein PHMEG_00025524 [Phytophthora megakarya]